MARVIPIGIVPAVVPPDPASVRIAEEAASFLSAFSGASARIASAQGISVASVAPDGFGLLVSVGLFPAVRPSGGMDLAKWKALRDSASKEIVFEVRAALEWLYDPLEAKDGAFWREFSSAEFGSLREAAGWIRAHCRPRPAARIPDREMRDWRNRSVSVWGRSMPFLEAVTALGARYREAISADMLVSAHGMTDGDAEAVADAAKRVLPKGRATR